jgi:hypothetical protein
MTRRTAEESKAWLEAAEALLADVGVEVMRCAPNDREAHVIAPRGMGLRTPRLRCYWSGACSIAGVQEEADWLLEPLQAHGLVAGWAAGSRGAGVIWAFDPTTTIVRAPSPPPVFRATGRRPEGWAVGDREAISAARRLGLDPNDLTRADLGRVLAEARP